MFRRAIQTDTSITFDKQAFIASKLEKASTVNALFVHCNRCGKPLGGDTIQDLRRHRASCPKTNSSLGG